ncbi:response regulator [Komarekiella sp. 'clone 1']|uniref:histidine kinase n=1 Tax=Komarekiella delphini-convector SJRDD-AB1 TaxID=2593771 RepID=A0AA40T0C8_9NOST|nr:ATP-binding protein [Komarekiella delphini-convector]MBD6618636.1 response regulator [Komarekiella delphini-convector SJRDD-AB1]
MTQDRQAAEQLFTGNSEMAMRMRSLDWSQTSLGAIETWPQSLRSALSICLNSRFPIAIYWGWDCLLLYNDAWRPIIGNKHPWSLGRPAREVWSEIWDDIGPELASVLATGEGIFHNDELLSMHRFGYTEECFFEYTFNPIQGQGDVIDGVFNIVTETTYRVLNDRRARLLREVAFRTGTSKTTEEACASTVAALKSDPADIPLAFLYLIDSDGKHARLCGGTEFALDSFVSPEIVDLAEENSNDGWAIALAARTARSQAINDLVSRFGKLPGSPWTEPPQEAMVLPITAAGQGRVTGVLVAVASPRRRLDDTYRDFFNQLTGQIAMAIANARSYEEERQRAVSEAARSAALAELDRAKTVFFSNVSHEFRTPLTLMLSPLEEAITNLSGTIPAEEREQLQLVQRNGLRLLKLVNTLLDFSRIEAGRVQASYEPTDLATFTAELASVFRSAIKRANLRLVVDCPPMPDVYIDREMWEKIVFNLLSNAFKFTFAGEISVSLQWQSDHIELVVRDTGIGIPAAELPHLFERFHRVKGSQGRSIEGSGIGLSLVQELVKLHQGSINVTSVEGAGSCFNISIPTGTAHLPQDRIGATRIASTALGANPYLEEAFRWLSQTDQQVTVFSDGEQSSASVRSKLFSSARIILADDNADMRDYVRRLLSQQYEVVAVSDGVAALSAIHQQVPDLVLTDVMMPNLDGFGLLQAIRSDPQIREVPIIMLSARAGKEARIEGLAAGADDYLIKPFSARELLARVEATLKLAQLRREATQREQALRLEAETAKQQVETVLSSIRDGFYALDRNWNFTYVNDRYCKMVGMQREEILEQNVWELFPSAVDTDAYVQFHRAITEQTPLQFEYFYAPWNCWHDHRIYPSSSGLSVFLADISARKQAELERERLLGAEQQAREEAQAANRIKDEFLAVLSHELRSPLNPILGWSKLLKTGKLDEAKTAQALTVIERNAKLQSELIEDLLDVSRILRGKLSLNVSPIDLVTTIQAAIETVRLAAQAKSIDLRFTILDLGLNNVDVSPKSPNSDEQPGNLKSQSRLGKFATQGSPLTLDSDSVSDVGASDSLTLHYGNFCLRHATRTQNPKFQISGDSNRIQQVIWNLLSNAVKFTDVGGQVDIRLERLGCFAQISVSDTGKGIRPDFLPYVFDYFRQEDGATTRKFGGLGLGLAIVHHLVELHGGTVQAESPGEGQGTTFTMRLPLMPTSAQTNQDSRLSEPALDLTGIQVLVVDDDADTREFVGFLIEQYKANVITVASAEDALLALANSKPDVLLSDIGMPEVDGYMLVRQVRALPPEQGGKIPAIALTAYAGEIDYQQAILAGFQRHIPKPVDPANLVEAIADLVRHRQ